MTATALPDVVAADASEENPWARAWRRLKRGDLGRYLATAASVPALIVYLAAANAGPIIGAVLGRKTEFNRTPKAGT